MTRLATFVARHPVATYVGLTFAISWGGALLAIGGSGAMRGTTPASEVDRVRVRVPPLRRQAV